MLLASFGRNPFALTGASPLTASEVNVTVEPSPFVNVSVVPTAMFEKSETVIVQFWDTPPNLWSCQATVLLGGS